MFYQTSQGFSGTKIRNLGYQILEICSFWICLTDILGSMLGGSYKMTNRDSRGSSGLPNFYVGWLLFKSTHEIDNVPDVLIGNFVLIFGHFISAEFGFVEMLAICLGLVCTG